MKLAVVHDYFIQAGGAEKVAEELYVMLPGAKLFTTVALPDKMPSRLKGVPVRTSWMQKMPHVRELYRLYLFLYPFAVGSLDLSQFDLVVSSSSGYAKGIRTGPDTVHVCYCHTPMRWVWDFERYSSRETFTTLQKTLLPLMIKGLKKWDEAAAKQPDYYIANSHVVAERIKKAYGRSAEVIYPPIAVDRFSISDEREDHYLVLSRLVSHKRIDLAVRACTMLNRPLWVIGTGPDEASLRAIAGPTVKFLGHLSDKDVNWFISRCRALLFPGEEDFGMTPLEAAAAGRPTIAYRAGGAVETILDGVSGLFFDEQSAEHLAEAIERLEQQSWNPEALRRHAEKFSTHVFREHFISFLNQVSIPARPDSVNRLVGNLYPAAGASR